MSAPKEPGLIGRVAGAVTGRMVDVVPPEVILDHLDLDAFLDRVDLNHLLDRVDVDRLLARVDLNRLLAEVDLNALLSDVELEELVRRAGIPALVTETTGHLAGSTLRSAQRQLAGVDTLLARIVDRLLRRTRPRPTPPPPAGPDGPAPGAARGYAGGATRAVAALLDNLVILGSFAVVVSLGSVLVRDVLGLSVRGIGDLAASLALAGWAFVYLVVATAVTGRTVGKALAGIRLQRSDGRPLSVRAAVLRVLVFPFSTSFAGLGLFLLLVEPRSRALHDLIAGTVVVYDRVGDPARPRSPLADYLARHRAG